MFDNDRLTNVGGSSGAPRIYTYKTDDSRLTVLSSGYFNELYTKVSPKDIFIINNHYEVYTVRVLTVSQNSVVVEKTALSAREYVHYYTPVTTPIILNDDGITYTQVNGMVAPEAHEFEVSGNNLVYIGVGGKFLFNGSSNLESNKVAEITIALSINDVVSPQTASISFANANKKRSVASTGIFTLSTNDVLKVLMKGDTTGGLTPSIYSMNVTLLEI